MCRSKAFCSLLGEDSNKWSRECPLPKPIFFEKALNTFVKAFSNAINGDIQSAVSYLQQIPDSELKEWYIEHGQMSGWHHRVKVLNLPKPPNSPENWTVPLFLPNFSRKFFYETIIIVDTAEPE